MSLHIYLTDARARHKHNRRTAFSEGLETDRLMSTKNVASCAACVRGGTYGGSSRRTVVPPRSVVSVWLVVCDVYSSVHPPKVRSACATCVTCVSCHSSRGALVVVQSCRSGSRYEVSAGAPVCVWGGVCVCHLLPESNTNQP